MTNRLSGIWTNEYGSRMEIGVDEGGNISGLYSSTTGATGSYRVTGLTDIYNLSGNPGVVINILWRPLDAVGDDPSYHYLSGMVGQLQTVDGRDLLTVQHLLLQETNHGDNWQSTFIDKLVFTRAEE